MNQRETARLRKIIFLNIVILAVVLSLARVKPAHEGSTPDGSIQRYRARKMLAPGPGSGAEKTQEEKTARELSEPTSPISP